MTMTAFKVIDRLLVVAHGARSPSDEEWIAYLKEIGRQGVERTLQLTYT